MIIEKFREESPEAIEIRRVFSKLLTLKEERGVKTIMMTSSALGEGKSTTAAYLAIACSRYRKLKTLLIDMDLRRPRVHELFGVHKKGGMSDILMRKTSIRRYVKKCAFDNLSILTSGKIQESPSELFNTEHIREVFSEAKFYFDFIIVDAPPVIPVSDPLMLSSEVDGALFVIKAGQTQEPVIQRAVKLLRDAKIEIFGAIVNNIKHVLPYYYDYRFYNYSYYSSEEEEA
jgi:capsular exopolysaccharide synthesis family protein